VTTTPSHVRALALAVLALGAAGPLLTAVMVVAAGGGVDAEVLRTLAAVAIASLVGAGLVTWQSSPQGGHQRVMSLQLNHRGDAGAEVLR
jgi:hypothetical protein